MTFWAYYLFNYKENVKLYSVTQKDEFCQKFNKRSFIVLQILCNSCVINPQSVYLFIYKDIFDKIVKSKVHCLIKKGVGCSAF